MESSLFTSAISPKSETLLKGIARWARVLSISYLVGSTLFFLFVIIGMIVNKEGRDRIDYEGLGIAVLLIILYLPAAILLLKSSSACMQWYAAKDELKIEQAYRFLKMSLQWAGVLSAILVVLFFMVLGLVAVIDLIK